MTIVGIDIGGSGIKGAPVDLAQGRLAGQRHRVLTPQPADVTAVAGCVATVAARCGSSDAIGITFPGVVLDGVTRTAANLDPSWIDAPAEAVLSAAVDRPVVVLNDADAAGVAEVTFGAGRGVRGVTLMVTFGTGIGTAIFVDGRLVPNTELGHVLLHGADAEDYASDRVREVEELDWPAWAVRVGEYLAHLEALLWPNLIIIGGGVSKRAEHFLPLIDLRTPVVPAALQNHAGIIGAALAARDLGRDGGLGGAGGPTV
jgi:polyphosphate glucokinase